MRAVAVRGRIPTRHIRIVEVDPSDTDSALLEEACRFAGEETSSLFGFHVDRYPEEGIAHVALYTD